MFEYYTISASFGVLLINCGVCSSFHKQSVWCLKVKLITDQFATGLLVIFYKLVWPIYC